MVLSGRYRHKIVAIAYASSRLKCFQTYGCGAACRGQDTNSGEMSPSQEGIKNPESVSDLHLWRRHKQSSTFESVSNMHLWELALSSQECFSHVLVANAQAKLQF